MASILLKKLLFVSFQAPYFTESQYTFQTIHTPLARKYVS